MLLDRHCGRLDALHPTMIDPWAAAADWGAGTVLAVLMATEGPSYRDPGAALACHPDGRSAGTITSGCVEADLLLRADEVRRSGVPQRLRYGTGSPFFDLRLPCGGAIEVLLFAANDVQPLVGLARARAARQAAALEITGDGCISLGPWQATGAKGQGLVVGFQPELRCLVFGSGAEAAAFCSLLRGFGYDHLLATPSEAMIAHAAAAGSPALPLDQALREGLQVDAGTAAILFFHDHDLEPLILQRLLETPAFYIGAQGSRATQAARLAKLRDLGVPDAQSARVIGPVGLIPSSRDPKSLAVSVLAEILKVKGA
jgi:xanthine dehydrogenase accessory factor